MRAAYPTHFIILDLVTWITFGVEPVYFFILLQIRTVLNFKDNLRNIDRCDTGNCNLWERLVPKIWHLPVVTIHTKSEASNLIGGLLTDVTKYTVSHVQVSNYSNINSWKLHISVLSVRTHDWRSIKQ